MIPSPSTGMCVMGVVNPNKVLTNAGAKIGDKLFLTKPIGTGIITTAIKHDTAPAEVAAEAIRVMTTLNASASEAAVKVGCNACTDVTGFGLLGHLHEMTFASGVGARIRTHDVPLIDGVRELLALDEAPGGTYANRDHLKFGRRCGLGGRRVRGRAARTLRRSNRGRAADQRPRRPR